MRIFRLKNTEKQLQDDNLIRERVGEMEVRPSSNMWERISADLDREAPVVQAVKWYDKKWSRLGIAASLLVGVWFASNEVGYEKGYHDGFALAQNEGRNNAADNEGIVTGGNLAHSGNAEGLDANGTPLSNNPTFLNTAPQGSGSDHTAVNQTAVSGFKSAVSARGGNAAYTSISSALPSGGAGRLRAMQGSIESGVTTNLTTNFTLATNADIPTLENSALAMSELGGLDNFRIASEPFPCGTSGKQLGKVLDKIKERERKALELGSIQFATMKEGFPTTRWTIGATYANGISSAEVAKLESGGGKTRYEPANASAGQTALTESEVDDKEVNASAYFRSGFQVRYAVNQRFTVESGISYSRQNFTRPVALSPMAIDDNNSGMGTYQEPANGGNQGFGVSYLPDAATVANIQRDAKEMINASAAHVTIESFEIPVNLIANIGRGRIRFPVSAGVQGVYISRVSQVAPSLHSAENYSTGNDIRTFALNGEVSAGVQYRVLPHVTIEAKAFAQQSLVDISSNSGYSIKPRSLGASIGLFFSL